MDRAAVWRLLFEYTKNENLRKQALALEACMRAYARKFGEDEEAWGPVGLLHDFDYEMYPDAPDHPLKGSEFLAQRGVPEPFRKRFWVTPPIPGCPATPHWPAPCLPATS